ncbi:hypothetical protein GF318_02515 [Candidatus Micrarchaeota archaeon]|nr:hypothetical protein [Candidatus Micrarchaeota archaeon]
MIGRNEVLEFKKSHDRREKQIKELGAKECSAISRLSDILEGLIEEIESTQEREQSLWNPDVSTKIKMAKKGMRLSKKLEHFGGEVAREFENGNISQENGKKFISIVHHIEGNKMHLAKQEFSPLQEIARLNKAYTESREEMERKDRLLRKEQHKIENLLKELENLEKEKADPGKVQKYREFLENLEQLEKARQRYLDSLTRKPVAELLGGENRGLLHNHWPGLPAREELSEIRKFFSDYPELGGYRADQLCGLFGFSEKKLSHICPETSRFKKVILKNRVLFEELRDSKRTGFLAVRDDDEQVLDFFAGNVEGAKKAVENINALREEKDSCKKEYEKHKRLEQKRKELSEYSKAGMEEELRNTEALLELLHSTRKTTNKGEGGLLSKIASFFRTGTK